MARSNRPKKKPQAGAEKRRPRKAKERPGAEEAPVGRDVAPQAASGPLSTPSGNARGATVEAGAPQMWVGLLIVCGIALAVRLIYLWSIRGMGFFEAPVSDGLVYWRQAGYLLDGHWWGSEDFVHAPLYAYLLAAVRGIAGDSLLAPRLLQAVLGSLTAGLALLIGRRLYGRPVGLIAGLMLALYPPAIFYDGLIQKANLTLFLSTLTIWLILRTERAAAAPVAGEEAKRRMPTLLRWSIAGAGMGLLILTRQNALLLVPLLLGWCWWANRGSTLGRKLGCAGTTFLAMMLVLSPWVIRNRVVTGDWVLTTPNLGQNLSMGNNEDATGTYLPFQRGMSSGLLEQRAWQQAAEAATGRTLTPAEVSDYYQDAALHWMREHPGDWAALTAKKLAMVFGAYECPDTEDYYLYLDHAAWLGWLDKLWHFGVLLPLAVAGFCFSGRTARSAAPGMEPPPCAGRTSVRIGLLIWVLLTAGGTALFVVFGRYRLPMIPVLIVWAAAGLFELWQLIKTPTSRPRSRIWIALGLALAAAVVSNWRWHHPRQPALWAYTNHAVALADAGRYQDALNELDHVFAEDASNVDAHATAGSIQLDAGDLDAAWEHYLRATEGDPTFAGGFVGLGNVRMAQQRFQEAAGWYEKAVDLRPGGVGGLTGWGVSLAALGRYVPAQTLLNRALAIDPEHGAAVVGLGNLQLATQAFADAKTTLQRATEIDSENANAWHSLGLACYALGEVPAAEQALRRSLSIQPGHPLVQEALLSLLLREGRAEAALELLREWRSKEPDRPDLERWQAEVDQLIEP
jgi:tetratricopeptide (TPR) repeat protein